VQVLIQRKCSESLYRHLEDIFLKQSYKILYNDSYTVGSTKIAVIWDVVCTETSSRIHQNFGVYEITWHYILKSQCDCS
jgi:hypothetical protein